MSKWLMPWMGPDELDRFFDDPFFSGMTKGLSMPRTDVYEKDGRIVMEFDMPGVNEDDIDVEITDKVVMVKGECKDKKEVKDKKFYRMESKMSSFSRQIAWPVPVEYEKAEAVLQDGVLKVSAKKLVEEKKINKIKVKKLGK